MALPFTLEDTFRIHDDAVWNWLGGLRVDYGTIEPGAPVKNNQPIIRVNASPMREFADVVSTLVKNGWISGSNPATQAKNAGNFSILPLPLLTLHRGEPEIDAELSGPAKQFTAKGYNPATGQFQYQPWPSYYRCPYTVTLWSLKRYSDVFMREWVMAQFGADRGATYKEMMLPVQHLPPWGLMKQAFRFDGSSDLSDLEGESQRYIRVEFTFNLRFILMRNPIIPPNGQGTPINQIGIDVGVPGSDYGDTDLALQFKESLSRVAAQSMNLFSVPMADFQIPVNWPVTGTATAKRGARTPDGYFMKPNPNSLFFEVTGATDTATITNRQVAADTNGNAIVSISFKYLSNGPVNLQGSYTDPATGIVTPASFVLPLPAQTAWTKVQVFTQVPKNIFSWLIAGIGSNPKYDITLADIDVRHIGTQAQRPPDLVFVTGSETQYVWLNVSGPVLVIASLLSSTGIGDTLTVDNDVNAPTTSNSQPITPTSSGLVALSQPLTNSIRARVPLTVSLASIGLQVYAGAYNGHELSTT